MFEIHCLESKTEKATNLFSKFCIFLSSLKSVMLNWHFVPFEYLQFLKYVIGV